MTGAAGHLVSHSGYGSLIVPGVLLKGERKTPASAESPLQSAEGSKEPDGGQGTPRGRGPISRAAPARRSPRSAAGPGRTFTCQPHHPSALRPRRPGGRPSRSRHSSRGGCGRKNPKGIPSQRKKAKRLFLQAQGYRALGVQEATRHPCPTPTR